MKLVSFSPGGAAQGMSLSEELQELIARLAERLRAEAHTKIIATQAECDALVQREAGSRMATEQALAAAQARQEDLERELAASQLHSKSLQERLQQETIARSTAEQHVVDLTDRLAENDAHRQSLEEKHNHARAALEHYRQAAKEQRDQDQRRHEHQLQEVQTALRQAQQLFNNAIANAGHSQARRPEGGGV